MGSYTDDFLKRLRNQVNIDRVIDLLMLDTRQGNNLRRFRCPLCDRFHTATNPKTNLGRCFECQKNFNPIDLVVDYRAVLPTLYSPILSINPVACSVPSAPL